MKKGVSLSIFAIVITSLLVFSGSAVSATTFGIDDTVEVQNTGGVMPVMAADEGSESINVTYDAGTFNETDTNLNAFISENHAVEVKNNSHGIDSRAATPYTYTPAAKAESSLEGKDTVAATVWLPKEVSSPPVEDIISKKVSAREGGTIVITENLSKDLAGFRLIIPPGALAEDTVITVGEVVDGVPPAPEGLGFIRYVISLEPTGLTFKRPVTLEMPLPEELLNGENVTVEELILKKYNKASNTWTDIPVKHVINNTIVAQIKSFCFLGIGLFCNNPACEHRILEQAREWCVVGARQILHDPDIFVGDITFADKIGHLLLAEAWRDKILDGKFHDGADLVKVAMELGAGVVVGKALEAIGLGALKKFSPVTIGITLGSAIVEGLNADAFNDQLKAYLSWRGWFFEDDRWRYNERLARPHYRVMNDHIHRNFEGGEGRWFRYWRSFDDRIDEVRHGLGPVDIEPDELFNNFGKPIYDMLHKIHCTPVSPYNQLAQDRALLRSMFTRLWDYRPSAHWVEVSPATKSVVLNDEVSLSVLYYIVSDITGREICTGIQGFRWYVQSPLEDQLRPWKYGKREWGEREDVVRFTPQTIDTYKFRLVVHDGVMYSRPFDVHITVCDRVDGIPPGDVTHPTITSFTVEPVSITAGSPVTINFTARDNIGGSGIGRIILNRAVGEPENWEAIGWYCFITHQSHGLEAYNFPWNNGVLTGVIQDTPPSAGTFWYGLRIIDKAGNHNCEQNSQTNNQPGDFGPDKVQVEIDPQVLPDLTVTSVTLSGASAQVGDTVQVTFTVENKGASLTEEFQNAIFLSTARFGGGGAENHFLGKVPMSLAGAISRTETVEVTIPQVAAGNWYIAVFTDAAMLIEETNEMNNIDSDPISLTTPVEAIPVSGVTLTPATLNLVVGGEPVQLTAIVEPENATNPVVTWSSDNPTVATVNENGLVTPVAIGTATISVTTVDGGYTGASTVTVIERVVVAPPKEWDLILDSPDWDHTRSVLHTADGGFIILGRVESFDGEKWDIGFRLAKINAHGIIEWDHTFDLGRAYSIQQTNDGGFIIAGTTGSTAFVGIEKSDAWLIKLDAQGNKEWHRTFDRDLEDVARSVQQTADGGFIIAGSTGRRTNGWPNNAFWVIKTDEEGNKEWDSTFNRWRSDTAFSIQQTADEGFIIAGRSWRMYWGLGQGVHWLVRIDAQGNKEWDHVLDFAWRECIHLVQETQDGNFIVAGRSIVRWVGDSLWIIEIDTHGNRIWEHIYPFCRDRYGSLNLVQRTTDGGFIIHFTDLHLLKLNVQADREWKRTFEQADHVSWGHTVQQTTDGGFIFAANSRGVGGRDDTDIWLVKTDAQGNKEWEHTFGGTDRDLALSVQQTSDGGFIITGKTMFPDATHWSLWLIKLAP
ncbi:Ig-like domain-containing protein, partial [Thermodesulfovibrionales bacterium]|nr:Ig-like domain-containing protein [Thermodesulfovibrionales bacterium]